MPINKKRVYKSVFIMAAVLLTAVQYSSEKQRV